VTLAKVKELKIQQKNWPAKEFVLGLEIHLSNTFVIEARGARAFSIQVKLILSIKSGTIKVRCEAN
jgi:hypothetical protein